MNAQTRPAFILIKSVIVVLAFQAVFPHTLLVMQLYIYIPLTYCPGHLKRTSHKERQALSGKVFSGDTIVVHQHHKHLEDHSSHSLNYSKIDLCLNQTGSCVVVECFVKYGVIRK